MDEWVNWSGGVRARPMQRLEIGSEERLADLIRGTDAPIRVVGSGHSFSPLAAGEGVKVSLTGLDHVRAEKGAIRAGTGVILGRLTARMHDLGHALPNMGDIDAQTLGGGLATGTHGTGADFPCYSGMLRAFTLIDGQGARHVLSRDRDEPAFRAMAVSLGTGGILTEAVMTTVPPYRLARRRFARRLSDLVDDLPGQLRSSRNTEFYYITHSGVALGLESAATDAPAAPRPPDRDQEGLRDLKRVARLLDHTPRLRRWLLGRLLMRHTAETFTEDWHRAYPTDREGMRFEETEWHVPAEAGGRVLSEVVAVIERHFPGVYFPMEIRITGGDNLFLSPFHGSPRVSIAVHHEAGQPFGPILDAIQPVFLRAGSRPHWGKRHGLTAAELRPLYPHWDEAIEARRHFDPAGRFLTPYLRALLGL